jgi:hypothetical protein
MYDNEIRLIESSSCTLRTKKYFHVEQTDWFLLATLSLIDEESRHHRL